MQLALSDIESGQESTILVRERTRNTTLDPVFAKKHGKILSSTRHTISFLASGRSSAQLLSKRDIVVQRQSNITPIGDVVIPGTCCTHRSPAREEEHGRDQHTCSSSPISQQPEIPASDDSIIYVKNVPENAPES